MRKPRAIVCDDDDAIVDVCRHLLESMGYEVLASSTPVTCAFYRKQADNCPQHNRCADILITDNNMPGMTGIELLEVQHHRGCKLTSKNKVLITGGEDSGLRKRAAALGCEFFPKPVLISTIFAWVKECEKNVDLSEPLALELFLPVKQEAFCVDSPNDVTL